MRSVPEHPPTAFTSVPFHTRADARAIHTLHALGMENDSGGRMDGDSPSIPKQIWTHPSLVHTHQGRRDPPSRHSKWDGGIDYVHPKDAWRAQDANPIVIGLASCAPRCPLEGTQGLRGRPFLAVIFALPHSEHNAQSEEGRRSNEEVPAAEPLCALRAAPWRAGC